MRTLSTALSNAQKAASRRPYVQAVFDDYWGDRYRLRLTRYYTGSENAGYAAACIAPDGSLVRARVDGTTLYVSRVSSPGSGSTYSSWTNLNACANSGIALAKVGGNVFLFYTATGGTALTLKTSSDNGATWSGPTTVSSGFGTIGYVAAAERPSDADWVVFWNEGATVYHLKGSVFTRTAWSNSVASVTGLACDYGGDWKVIVTGTAPTSTDAKVWACLFGDGLDQTANTWSSLIEVTTAVNGSNVAYQGPALESAGASRLWFCEKYTGSLAYSRLHQATLPAAETFKEERWSEPAAVEITGDNGVAAAASGSGVWLVQAAGVWFAAAPPATFDATGDVLEARLDQDGDGARVRLVLDNSHKRYSRDGSDAAKVGLGFRLKLNFGMYTASVSSPEVPTGADLRYWVTEISQEWSSRDGRSVLVLEARDAWHLLESWRARRQLQWASGTKSVNQILMYLVARTGLEFSNLTNSSAITALQPAFTVHPGESGAAAVKRLLAKVPDVLLMRSGLVCTVHPQAADSSQYTYGTDHGVLGGRYAARPVAPNRVRVFGASVFDEDFDFAGVHAAGEVVRNVVDIGLTTTGQAGDRGDYELRRVQMAAEDLEVLVPMNGATELWDVVTVTDGVAGLSSAKRRVLGLSCRYVAGVGRKRGAYELELRLGAA